MKKNLIIGIIVLIVLVGGVVLWGQKNNQQGTNQPKQQTKKEVVKQGQEQKIAKEFINSFPKTTLEELDFKKLDMSNWKTYRNEEFGFEVKYPQNWTYGELKCDAKKCGFPNNVVEGVVFNAPGDTPGGGTWAVSFLDNDLDVIEKDIDNNGSQFNDRVEKRNSITFQNRSCMLVGIASAQNKWMSRNIFCPYKGKIFKIYLDGRGYFQGFKFIK